MIRFVDERHYHHWRCWYRAMEAQDARIVLHAIEVTLKTPIDPELRDRLLEMRERWQERLFDMLGED